MMWFISGRRSAISLLVRHLMGKQFRTLTSNPDNHDISVVYSLSNCPYENLAYEDHIYETEQFENNRKLLYIWRNDKTVVIGRHQNPWNEVKLDVLRNKTVSLCRRKSGGGTVYHDLGNVNLTFFTSKTNHNRKENLDFLIKFLNKQFSFNTNRNSKDDIVFNDNYKISGTAAKIGLHNSYHHCTLLCNANLHSLDGLLKHSFGYIETNATKSIPSPTTNLFAGDKFNFTEFYQKLYRSYFEHYRSNHRVYEVHPADMSILSEKVKELKSWDWVYGKSPKFSYKMTLQINGHPCNVSFIVYRGKIDDISVSNEEYQGLLDNLKALIGVKFHSSDIKKALESKHGFFSNDIIKQILDSIIY